MLARDFNFLQSNENLHLSVIIMTDSFYYAVIDQNQRLVAHSSFLSVRYSDPTSTGVILNDATLKADYTAIHVIVFNPWQVQLSSQDEGMLAILPSMYGKEISKHALSGSNGAAYYAMTTHQAALIDYLFQNKPPTITNVIEVFANYFRDESGKLLHVHMDEEVIHVYMQQGQSFVFYNQFSVAGGHDIVYFILALCQENTWSPSEVNMSISGWIAVDNAIMLLLNTYFPHLKMIEQATYTLPVELDASMRPSFYFAHFAGRSCA